MCGFAGFIDLHRSRGREERGALAASMADALLERGPDDRGAWADPDSGYAVGFRRLSIIDVSPAGHQPMVSADGRYVIAFNGEAYNAADLRPELETSGTKFRGHSDTEVVLEACAAAGQVVDTVRRLIGMFAIALWDRRERRLHLVRDRLGIKPLYWGRVNGTVFFGSQPKGFFAHPDWRARIDPGALASYTRFGYVPSPQSIFQGLEQLAPGHAVVLDEQGSGTPRPYWDLPEIASGGLTRPIGGDDGEVIAEMESLLRDAVRKRMIADVPLGAFLSGGVDSSLVVALMQSESARPVKTFSIGFWEPAYDESPHAKAVAAHLGTEHHELRVEPRHALEVIPELPRWYDEPFADSSQIPTLLVSRLTREHVTVCLSGDGGDELFAGYPRYQHAIDLWGRSRSLPPLARRAAAAMLSVLSPAAWERLGRLPGLDRLRLGPRASRLASMLEEGRPESLYRDLVSHWHDAARLLPRDEERLAALWRGSLATGVPDLRRRLQLIDMLTYLPDDILTKVDRASMAASLEARVPLLDHRVVERAWRLPGRFAVRDGTTKWLLRRILYRHVPPSLIERPKMGFGVPIEQWLRGPLRDWAEDLLGARQLRDEGWFDPVPVRRRWQEHLSGQTAWHYPLWVILMFQSWRRQWSIG